MTYSQSELATLLGTTESEGTSHSQMFNGGIKLGLEPTQVRDINIDVLKEVLPEYHVVVNWMEDLTPDGGHYSVLKDIRDGKVYLQDNEMEIEEFDKRWYDFEADGKRIDKWAMLVKRNPA